MDNCIEDNDQNDIEQENMLEEDAEVDSEYGMEGTSNEESNNYQCDIDDDANFVYKRLLRKQTNQSKQHCAKEERNATIKKVQYILQKPEHERTSEEQLVLKACGDIVKVVQSRRKKRDEAKRRLEEFEDPMDVLQQKCQILAQAIAQSQHLVIYTGAGISTAARIPDYRGTNGIWTMLQQGKDIGNHDLSLAEPTYTHMALSELYKRNILKYVVSQNCDGLHLRSGLPRTVLSEVHGNMYVEVCKTCKPSREYWRLFDVTENTARFSHKTTRKCYVCNGPLCDTIVHFGERGSLQWPLNWSGASKNARKATTIVCLGSSLKVLKKYPWLWQMHKPVKRRPNLYIVNLQWTPKDDCANVKIHGKCDIVMRHVMDLLGIQVPTYDREKDPIFVHGTHLLEQEYHTTTQPLLKFCGKYVPGKVVKVEEVKKEEENQSDLPTTKKECDDAAPTESVKIEVDENDLNGMSPDHPAGDSEPEEDDDDDDDAVDDVEDMPINYSKNPNSNSKHLDDCDTISNIYSINQIPLAASLPQPVVLKTPPSSKPQVAHNNSSALIPKQQDTSSTTMSALNLVAKETLQSTLFTQNCQALLTYYQLSNRLLQSPLGLQAYRDILYPLQTSFLYSGLHSIINPTPFLPDGTTLSLLKSEELKEPAVHQENPEPACDYCYENYKSFVCVYYEKLEPGFVKQRYRFSKADNCRKPVYCLCCDYTTEEEEEEESVEGSGPPPDKISKVQEDSCGGVEQKAKIQPGWYGKGYRKNKKHRKKAGA